MRLADAIDDRQVRVAQLTSEVRQFLALEEHFPRNNEFGRHGLPSLASCARLLGCDPSRDAILAALGLEPFQWFRQIAERELRAHSTRRPNQECVEGDPLEPKCVYLAIFRVATIEEVYALIKMDLPPE